MTVIARSIVHADAALCGSHHDGHRVHHIRALRALQDRDLAVHVLVEIVDESVVQLSWDGQQFQFRHHDVDSIADAFGSDGEVGEWIPRWRVLVLPGRGPDDRTVFTLSDSDHWTACSDEAYTRPVSPRVA
ncbi:hypothetical protein [Rhodococcus yananensis]|uniref:hypothetical protein n=1 Tax=Rhodococcus yananensis TaxID=2879464 RepID=UPI003EBF7A1D